MIGVELTVKLNADFGQVDMARLERIIHEAVSADGFPIVDVELDGTKILDAPLPQVLGPPDYNRYGPAGVPLTHAPGERPGPLQGL